MPNNSAVVHTGTTFGQGLHGDVIKVTYKGSTICAAKKYRNIDRAILLEVFGREKDLCRIRHPNLVAYCGVGSLVTRGLLLTDRPPVVVMERMEMNLGTFLGRESLSLIQKLKIFHGVMQGLNVLHSQTPPIVHGGLNERNVLLTAKRVAKISDFGNNKVIRAATEAVTTTTTTTTTEGTGPYAAPEVEEGEYTEKIDVFSLGHLAIYIMNQTPPHPILTSKFKDKKDGKLLARSEIERRAPSLKEMKHHLDDDDTHPLFVIVTDFLDDDADSRPSCRDILRSGILSDSEFIMFIFASGSIVMRLQTAAFSFSLFHGSEVTLFF